MRKTDKKLDKQIRLALTRVCEGALHRIKGFTWLTHQVNYEKFPDSLMIYCIFELNDQLSAFLQSDDEKHLLALIQCELKTLNIQLKPMNKHVIFDTEENCQQHQAGNWAVRLKG